MARVSRPEPLSGREPCARCGGNADFDIASLWLCVDCYHIAGSTCAGIGRVRGSGTGPRATAAPAATPTATLAPGAALPGATVVGDADQVC